jgi:hypothetical protein
MVPKNSIPISNKRKCTLCEICYSVSIDYEDYHLLGYDRWSLAVRYHYFGGIYCLYLQDTLQVKTTGLSEMLVPVRQITSCHILKASNHRNLKPHTESSIVSCDRGVTMDGVWTGEWIY